MNKRMKLNWACVFFSAFGIAEAVIANSVDVYVPSELAKVVQSDGGQSDHFGSAVSITEGIAVIGSPNDDYYTNSGSVTIFLLQADGRWVESYRIIAYVSDYNYFGQSVSVEGSTLVVGCTDGNANNYRGAAYVYEQQQDLSWIETAYFHASDVANDDYFGSAVHIDGDRIIIGAESNDDNGSSSGSAYIFERQENNTWAEVVKLLPSDGSQGDNFGDAVAISGDTAIVGAPRNNGNSGSVYVFELQEDNVWLEVEKLVASDGSTDDYFGESLDIFENTIVVGADQADVFVEDAGAAYVYEHQEDGSWIEITKLTASFPVYQDRFGCSVSISDNQCVVGAYSNNTNGENAGAIYAFEMNGEGVWFETAKFLPDDGQVDDNFGLAININSGSVVVGARNDDAPGIDSGSAYLFDLNSELTVGSNPWLHSIQSAINIFYPGYHTSINIPAGIYNESLYINKSMNLVGLDDASSCIIDASGLGGGVAEIVAGDSTFSNLTFTNGDASLGGGGISVIGGGAILRDCIVDSNEALLGGGVFTSGNASISLIDTEVTNNWAVEGGGLYSNENALIDLVGSRIAYNDAYRGGGAIFEESNVYIEESSFSANYAAENAGLLAISSLVDVNLSIFSGNQGKIGGGAITSQESLVFVGDSGFCQNTPVDLDGYWVDEGGNTFSADCYEIDCNQNGLNDQSEIALGLALDCNLNGIPDECDIDSGSSPDCNSNAIPDECDIAEGFSQDCNVNDIPDECDIADGTSPDVDGNGIPDECELDCNGNEVPDYYDIQEGTSMDCNANGVPDECDIDDGTEEDCDDNGIPDTCDLADGASDLNDNGIPDSCDIANGTEMDCNGNAIIDSWEIANGKAQDCNENEIPDSCDYDTGVLHDCDDNGVPDECKFADDPLLDCNENGILDLCDIDSEVSADLNSDWIPDECQCLADTDESASVDVQDILLVVARWGQNGEPGMLGDVNWDGTVGIGDLLYIVSTWGPCPE